MNKEKFREDFTKFHYRASFFIIVHDMYIMFHDLLPIMLHNVTSCNEAAGIAANHIRLQRMIYQSQPIVADCIFPQRITAHYIANAIRLDSPQSAAI